MSGPHRNRRGRACVVLLLGLFVSGVAGAQETPKDAPTTWHTTAYVRSALGLRVIDYWARGSDMVARTLIRGHPITTIVSKGRYVVFDAVTGKGIDVERAPAALALDGKRGRPFAFELEEIQAEGGEKVEDVVLGSMRGEIWQVRDERGRRKVWISSRPPVVPLRVETFDRASGDTVELDYQGWIFDLLLPDAFFAPPGGLSLQRFSQAEWLTPSAEGERPRVPILYPDLLFGAQPN